MWTTVETAGGARLQGELLDLRVVVMRVPELNVLCSQGREEEGGDDVGGCDPGCPGAC